MSFLSGGSGQSAARATAGRAEATARRGRQTASEEAGRAQQQAERGVTRRKGRSLLLGNLTRLLPDTLGG